jgi:sugar-specific transcriptional regulator TrmB
LALFVSGNKFAIIEYMMIAQELLAFGLTNKEADVYVAALQLGYASVADIAEKAGINRTTAYTHIKNLISRGLFNAVERMGKVYYVAEKPEKLQFIYEQQEKEIQRKKDLLARIMPELDSIYNLAKEKPSVRYFENGNELIALRKEISKIRTERIYNIFNYNIYREYINRKYIETLLSNTNSFSALYISNHNVVDPKLHPLLQNKKFNLRHLPADKFGFLCELTILDDVVCIARQKDCLMIREKLFAQTLGLVFQTLWGIGEQMNRSSN